MSGAPPPGHRGGRTFSAEIDGARLNRQAFDVWHAMRDMAWHTLPELSTRTGHPEASVSARLRDFRKERFGGHEVQRERIPFGNGLHRYRLVPVRADLEW
jgi:hypothetical protein